MKDLLASIDQLSADKRRALALLLEKKGIDLYQSMPIPRADRARPLPLSPAQERLWLLSQLGSDAGAYNIGEAVLLKGELDFDAVQQAADALLARHEILRTSFVEVDGRPTQRIHVSLPLPVQIVRLEPGQEPASFLGRARALSEEEAALPFELSAPPLLRLKLVELGRGQHLLLWTLHHIVSDGLSMAILIADFVRLYAAFSAQRPSDLPALALQYADYAVWQREWLETGRLGRQLEYWTRKLGRDNTALELPTDRPRPLVATQTGAATSFVLSQELSEGVVHLGRAQGATPFMVLLAVFEVLLQRCSGQNDFRIGVPMANRQRPELETVVGFFVNTLVFRAELSPRLSFFELLERVKATTLEAHANPDLPFERLVDALKPERRLGQNPLFEVMFNHQVGALGGLRRLPGLELQILERGSQTTQFDLTLDTETDESGRVHGSFGYRTELFDRSTIERLVAQFRRILWAVVAQPTLALSDIPILSAEEERTTLAFSRPRQPTPSSDGSVLDAIARHAGANPDAVALKDGDRALSYAELWRESGQVAVALRRFGLKPEARIGIAVERSVTMVVAMLGALRAGAAFVPLDLSYPSERLEYMRVDAALAVVLSDRANAQRLWCAGTTPIVELEELTELTRPDRPPIFGEIRAEQLAYVIYTSGSTGRPKGVSVSHGAISSHCRAIAGEYGLRLGEVVLQFASINFDGALDQWLAPLTAGATVLIRGTELWTFERTWHELEASRVTVVDLLPSYLLELARWAKEQGRRLPVRVCAVGGEALPREGLRLLHDVAPNAQIINGYGPTEAVVTPLTWTSASALGCDTPYAPIGTPLGERTALVLDAELNLVPFGVRGELYLGGPGLARGYHARPALTAERFLPDPFGSSGGRLYKTGDLAHLRTDGVVEYLGRADDQVKLRGFRIELGEIESALLAHGDVEEALVVLRENPKRLVAYVASARGPALEAELRREVSQKLPDYMLPAQVVVLGALPRSPVGKVDRNALPDVARAEAEVVQAETDGERTLLEIWRALLGSDRVGTTDNFFELGGDSILSIQLVSRAREAGLSLRPRDVFDYQTIRALARAASPLEKRAKPRIASGPVALTPIQASFAEQVIPARHHYNQAVLLEARQAPDVAKLRRAVEVVSNHHDVFGVRFVHDGRTLHQSYSGEPTPVEQVFLVERAESATELRAVCNRLQRSLKLESGPLLRVALITGPHAQAYLLLVVHHLISDGISFRVLLEDLFSAYSALEAGRAPELPAPTSSFAEWSAALQGYARSESLLAQLGYWQREIGAVSAEFPCQPAEVPALTRATEQVQLRLTERETSQLLREAPAAYRTQVNDLLLTALGRALARVCSSPEVLVELEAHGREDLFEELDVSRTLGWFTSTYPVRLSGSGELRDSILATKERLRAVPDRGLGYGVLRYLANSEVREELRALPRARVSFNYLGQFDQSFDETKSSFVPARVSAGDDVDPEAEREHWLEIDGQVFREQLEFTVSYSPALHSSEVVAQLAAEFRDQLLAVIEHCLQSEGSVTPSDFPLAKVTQAELERLTVRAREIRDIYPLTPMQRGMLFHSAESGESDPYVNQISVRVDGLVPERFKAAWHAVVAAHDVLRTSFAWQGLEGEPLQLVERAAELTIEEHDLRAESDPEPIVVRLSQSFRRKLSLERAPLMHLGLIRRGEQQFCAVWTAHHLILDGWSSSRLLGEVLDRYAGKLRSRRNLPYANYLKWLQGRDAAATEAFWRQQLAVIDEPTLLASASAPTGAAPGHGFATVVLAEQQLAPLVHFAQRERVTLSCLIQNAWAILLARCTGRRAVAFGATVSGRPPALDGADEMLGMFINTLPVVVEVASEQEVSAWLRECQLKSLAAREHEHTPLYDVQRWADVEGRSLFDSLIVFENYPLDEALKDNPTGLTFEVDSSVETTSYGMTLAVVLSRELRVTFEYDRAQYSERWVEELQERFVELLQRLTEARFVGELCLATASEQGRAREANALGSLREKRPSVVEMLARVIDRRASAEALVAGNERLSFAELGARARALASRLSALGVAAETRVGIFCGRGANSVPCMLGVWLAGGAYAPLDSEYPDERLEYMMADARIEVLLHERCLRASLRVPPGVTCIDVAELDGWHEDSVGTPPSAFPAPNQLAYVIFTSGSSGRPKGVEVEHGALAMHAEAALALYELGADDAALHFASMSFDAAVEQWLVPLLGGAKLVLSQGLWTGAETAAVVEREAVTVIYPPTSFVTELAQWALTNQANLGLRVCTVGGEAVTPDAVALIRRGLSPHWLINGYGPTEAVVTPLLWRAADDTQFDTAYAPIGKAVGERSVYVLDADLNLLPAGVVGEIYLGGSGLARGYQARPALTAERFVPDPFATVSGARLYRSGDLGRLLDDGNVEYVGRADQQVKVRGFRVELGEIEAALGGYPRVREAKVVLRQLEGRKQLVGYVAPDLGAASVLDLKQALRRELPEHMVPAELVFLSELPRTPNGKVDVRRLPEPCRVATESRAPSSDTERKLVEIWQSVLAAKNVGVDDNFFELGGDSILSIQIVSRARLVGVALKTRDVFEHQTIARLARVAKQPELAQELESTEGEIALTPIQAEFFGQENPARHHFNQSLLFTPKRRIDPDSLRKALTAVVSHHDALRLRFQSTPGSVEQRLSDEIVAEDLLRVFDAADEGELLGVCEETQRSLDLAQGPLLRAAWIRLCDSSERLLLVVHHLAIDGVSWRILLEDLASAYAAFAAGQARVELPSKSASFISWSRRLQAYAGSAALAAELEHWLATNADGGDPVRPAVFAHHQTETLSLRFGRELTDNLLRKTPAAFRTQVNDLLLTALVRALSRHNGRRSQLIELEGHGREGEQFDLDLSRTLGWFTSLFPVRLRTELSIEATLIGTKEALRRIPGHGLGYGVLKHLALPEVRRKLERLPRPATTFNYLGQFDATFSADAPFTPARESSGSDTDPNAPPTNALTINGQVYGAELELAFTFSTAIHSRAQIEALLGFYREELEALVELCLSGASGVTPADFPLIRAGQAELNRLSVPASEIEDVYPLTPMQQGMLFHALEAPGQLAYVNQLCVSVRGLEPRRFVAAWQQVVAAHEMLRVSFAWQGLREPVQIIRRGARLPVEELDLRGALDPAAAVAELREREQERGLSLDTAPLMRLLLARTAEDQWEVIWMSHHLILDGWSSARLLEEVLARYQGASPRPARGRFRDYLAWLGRKLPEQSEQFWRARLAVLDGPTRLGVSAPNTATDEGYGSARHTSSREETAQLLAAAQRARVTVNTLVQAAWALLLARHTGKSVVSFGATVAGRPAELEGAEEVLGLFINTLPVVVELRPEETVEAWLQRLQAESVSTREHEHTPLYDIQSWSGFRGEALFDSIVVFENYPVGRALSGGALGFELGAASGMEATNYALTVGVELSDTLDVQLDFRRDALSDEFAGKLSQHFALLLARMVDRPATRVGDLTVGQGLTRVAESPAVALEIPSVLESIAARASAAHGAEALVCAGEHLSYGELWSRVNGVARALLASGIQAESRVGVLLERSVGLVVGLLGAMRAGGAFVPLDVSYPAERLSLMLEDAAVSVVVTSRSVRARLEAALPKVTWVELEQAESGPAVEVAISAEQLAYVIYTSGSTGRPKGVGVTHGAIARHCAAIGAAYGLGPGETMLQFASMSFDGSLDQWLAPLVHGGRVLLRGPELWEPERTLSELERERVTVADFLPSYLLELARFASERGRQLALRVCAVGGEALSREGLELVQSVSGGASVINGYGPTEAVVTPLTWTATSQQTPTSAYAPIGSPIGDRTVYVLDRNLNALPEGVVGELYLGGPTLARGYQGRSGLTAERFVPDPFCVKGGGRLYRTGDLGRWQSDGALEYVGRADEQVKLRGYRVELGEVEAELLREAEVREAVVVLKESPKRLVGYVVANRDAEVSGAELRARLSKRMPEYMVPSAVVVVAELPRTPVGKVDKRRLPDAERVTDGYAPAETELERQLVGIWQEVLQLERVGVNDNFFDLGGHSILAMRVVSLTSTRTGLQVPLSRLLAAPTIRELARALESGGAVGSVLVPLNSQRATGSPLYCFHGAGGAAFPYRALASALERDVAVSAVQAPDFAGLLESYQSSAELIEIYVQAILRAQPVGPYRLAGWSLGGAIAVGVARQLELLGQRVAFLGLIDCFIPSLAELDRWNVAEQEREIASALQAVRVELESAGSEASSASAARELELGARVFRRLNELARSVALEPVRVAPSCWWSAEVDQIGFEHAQRELVGLIQTRARSYRRIESSHRSILDSSELHDALRAELAKIASVPSFDSLPPHARLSP